MAIALRKNNNNNAAPPPDLSNPNNTSVLTNAFPTMPLTAAERKRVSRARNPEACQHEKEKSRERMSVYRGKNRAQKRARDFKALLTDAEKEELEEEAKKHRISLLSDWLKTRDLGFSAEVMVERNITNLFVSKIEMHKIEKGVAEFEVAYIQEMLSRQSAAGDDAASKPAASKPAESKPAGSMGKTEYSSQGSKYEVPALPPVPAGKTEYSPQGSSDRVPALPPLPAPVTSNGASSALGNGHISGRQAPRQHQYLGGNADGRPQKVAAPSDAITQATGGAKGQKPHEDALNALLFAAGKMG